MFPMAPPDWERWETSTRTFQLYLYELYVLAAAVEVQRKSPVVLQSYLIEKMWNEEAFVFSFKTGQLETLLWSSYLLSTCKRPCRWRYNQFTMIRYVHKKWLKSSYYHKPLFQLFYCNSCCTSLAFQLYGLSSPRFAYVLTCSSKMSVLGSSQLLFFFYKIVSWWARK